MTSLEHSPGAGAAGGMVLLTTLLRGPAYAGNTDLVAYWSFNSAPPAASPLRVLPDLRAGLPARMLGGAAMTPGAGGQTGAAGDLAVRFGTANQRLHVTDASYFTDISAYDTLSVSYWIKQNAIREAAMFSFIAPAVSEGRGFHANTPWSDSRLYFDTGGCCDEVLNRVSVAGSGNWALWRHVTLVFDHGTKTIYLDGVPRITGSNTAGIDATYKELFIGNGAGATEAVNGDMDDFAVFSHAITDTDVADLASRSVTPLTLAGVLPTDADGDTLPDRWELRFAPDLTTFTRADGDYDRDGSGNLKEFDNGTSPVNPDSDDDSVTDGAETGTGTWVSSSNRGTSPLLADSDADGLPDGVETNTGIFAGGSDTGSHPLRTDTDDDGFGDALESVFGSDPNSSASLPVNAGGQRLLAWWPFNDAANPAAANDVILGIPGATTGTYTSPGGGRSGAPADLAMRFTDNASVTASAVFLNAASLNDAVTVSLWQRINSVREGSSFWVTSPSANAFFRGLQAHIPWSDLNMYFDHSGCCTPGIHRISAPLPSINTAQWHHFAFVKSGATTKQIYVDGILRASGTGSLPLPRDFTTLYIGGGPTGSIDGSIDDFVLYAGGLTQGQITRLAAGESPDTITGPAAPFEITASRLLAGDRIRLTWNSKAGSTYRVEGSPGHEPLSWSNLATGIPGVSISTTAKVNLPPGSMRLFVRVTKE